MSAEIIDTAGGVITAKITGKLTQPELAALQKATGDLILKPGKVRLLVVAENFEGWQRGGDCGDLTFPMKHDEHIEEMAIVCEKKWEDLALIFASKGMRKFPRLSTSSLLMSPQRESGSPKNRVKPEAKTGNRR